MSQHWEKLHLQQQQQLPHRWKSHIMAHYVNSSVLQVGSCHHIWSTVKNNVHDSRRALWSTVKNNVHDSRRAQLKCELLTGTYILQSNRAVFNQYDVNPTCILCSYAPETSQHFTAECVFFKSERDIYIRKLLNT